MNILEVTALSILQGISEWLPISSSGHLVLVEKLFEISEGSLQFDIFLHVASLVVIIVFFWSEIKKIFWSVFRRDESYDRKNWWWYIILSSVVTAAIGYALLDHIESFRTINSVGNWLLVTTLLLFSTKFSHGNGKITWLIAIVIGLVQGLAVIPGLSRSGTVIAVALLMKIKKNEAFDYGFLVAIPAIFGSFLLTINDFTFQWIYLVGFVITIFVGYAALSLLKVLVKRDYFYLFFIYTLLLGLIIKIS